MVLKIDVSILRVKVKALYLWWCLLYFGMHHIPGKENKNLKTLFYWYFQNFCVINLYFFWRVNEYKQEGENAELSKTAGELLENAEDPKFANSKVIMDY